MEASDSTQLLLRQVRQLAGDVAELKKGGGDSLIGDLAYWVATHLTVAAKTAASQTADGCLDFKLLRDLNSDVVALWRGEQCSERLKVEREWLELEVEKFRFDSAESAMEHAKEIKMICADKSLREKEMIEKVIRILFGSPPEDMKSQYDPPLIPGQPKKGMREVFESADVPEKAAANPSHADPIQPNPANE